MVPAVRSGQLRYLVWACAALGPLVGCGEDDARPPVPFDAGRPDASPPDAGPADVGPQDAGAVALPQVALPDLAPWTPPSRWRIASVPPGRDPIARPFFERRLERPPLGPDERGVTWSEVDPDAEGRFSVFSNWTLYGALPLELDAPLALSVRLHGFELVVDGRTVHDPDPYRTGRVRVPVFLAPGAHTLFLRGSGARGAPSIRFERAEGPAAPNRADVTRPDLVAGETLDAPLGVHLLNTSGERLEVSTWVLDHPWFEETARRQPPIPADAVSPVVFDLRAKAPLPEVETATLTLALEIGGTLHTFELALPGFGGGRAIRRSFVSRVDGSAQYYGENGPGQSPSEPAAMVLSLHGAGVEAVGQARAYDTKDWAHLIAPTNRRPFGFDWQDWGRLDAIEALEHAMDRLPHDPERVHVTGHSMGGHGTWHLGALYPDRFVTVGPSAGWIAFSTYGGTSALPPAWEPARLHDDTLRYRDNFADRAVYMIHGTNDDNVPIAQSRTMLAELAGIPASLELHEEPGAGHWWDGDPAPGARCVDFPPLFDRIRAGRLTPDDLDFDFVSPAPWVSSERSFARVDAVTDPYQPFSLTSRRSGARLVVGTDNVAALRLDGARLDTAGVSEVEVDGEARAVTAEPMRFGRSEKRPGRHGPVKEVFFEPFCFVHRDRDPWGAAVAANLTSVWAMIGNGAACTLPLSRAEEAGDRNRIYLGVPSTELALPSSIPFAFGPDGARLGETEVERPIFLGVTFPEDEHLSVALYGSPGAEWLVRFFSPFSSRSAYPDWFSFVLNDEGNPAYGPAGWFDAQWAYDSSLAR